MRPLFFFLLLVSSLNAVEPLRLALAPLQFIAPEGWIEAPNPSPMRKATWRTGPAADAAEISFFTFGKDQGGSVSSNIQRWFAQFSDSASKGESATVTINQRNVTFARTEGTFSSGMPGGATTPVPDQALCGAIIETEEGLVFIKMTGPKASIQKLEKTFTEVVTNAARS